MERLRAAAAVGVPNPRRPARVLVVDDEAGNRKVLRDILTQFGYEVVVAGEGVAALAEVNRKRPDVILLDVVMPGMTGIEVCRVLKRETRTRLIPVILLTRLGQRETRLAGLEAGADDFCEKPVDPIELNSRIRALLERRLR